MIWNSEIISLLIIWRKDLRDDIAVKQQKVLTEGEGNKWRESFRGRNETKYH